MAIEGLFPVFTHVSSGSSINVTAIANNVTITKSKDMAQVSEINLSRFRGDTVPDTFTIKDETGTVVDITGYNFLLTVDNRKNPTDSSTQVFSLSGVIDNPTLGVVSFSPSSLNVANSGCFFYDVQLTDGSGKIQTVAVGTFNIGQDITK